MWGKVQIGYGGCVTEKTFAAAFEAADAVMARAREVLGLKRVVAITSVDNEKSIRLLQKIGLRFEKLIRLAGDDEDVRLFSTG